VLGTPGLSAGAPFDLTPSEIFGVSYEQLSAVAEMALSDENDFPVPVPSYSIIVLDEPSVHFTNARPLMGTGLVYIRGNVNIAAGSNSVFTGVLFVDGNLTMRAPSEINGAVLVTGDFNAQGSGDYATITYDDEALASLRREFGKYRMSGAIRAVFRHDR
jgi:hypothetical protein